jgi:hypothetical protein
MSAINPFHPPTSIVSAQVSRLGDTVHVFDMPPLCPGCGCVVQANPPGCIGMMHDVSYCMGYKRGLADGMASK